MITQADREAAGEALSSANGALYDYHERGDFAKYQLAIDQMAQAFAAHPTCTGGPQ